MQCATNQIPSPFHQTDLVPVSIQLRFPVMFSVEVSADLAAALQNAPEWGWVAGAAALQADVLPVFVAAPDTPLGTAAAAAGGDRRQQWRAAIRP